MGTVRKFADLNVGSTYTVLAYDGPYTSKFGVYYILHTLETNSDTPFDMWTTKLLADYISEYILHSGNKFSFTVATKNDFTKYPVIEGYKKERKFTTLN